MGATLCPPCARLDFQSKHNVRWAFRPNIATLTRPLTDLSRGHRPKGQGQAGASCSGLRRGTGGGSFWIRYRGTEGAPIMAYPDRMISYHDMISFGQSPGRPVRAITIGPPGTVLLLTEGAMILDPFRIVIIDLYRGRRGNNIGVP